MIVPWQRLLQNFLSDYFTASSLSLCLYIYLHEQQYDSWVIRGAIQTMEM